MATRHTDDTRRENGTHPQAPTPGASTGRTDEVQGQSWNQGFANPGAPERSTSERPGGKYWASAMQRIGETRGQRAPGEIGTGRGFDGAGEDDPRARARRSMDERAGSYASGSYGSPAPRRDDYRASGHYTGGNLGSDVGTLERGGEEWRPQREDFEQARSRWQKEPLAARDVMTRNPRTVTPETTLREAAMLMRDEDTGIVPVADASGRLLGVLTDRDMVVRAFAFDRVPGEMKVSEIMSDEVACVTPDEGVHELLELMGKRQIRRVPVVDRSDRLVGIVSIGDIAQKADTDEELQEALHRISSRRSFWSRMMS